MIDDLPPYAPRPLPARTDGKRVPTYRTPLAEQPRLPKADQRPRTRTLCFENPLNGYREVLRPGAAFWGCAVFGVFYFIVKGVWRHVFLWLLLVPCTAFVALFIYPFRAHQIVATEYRRRGWKEISLDF